jgi:hypothetical protein
MAEPEEKTPVPIEQVDPRTRAQVKKELHEKNQEERKRQIEQLKVEYSQIKDSPALADILKKAREFAAWHLKLAKDGVGSRVLGADDNGNPKIEEYYLTPEQRIAELDQCKGQEQLIAYIEGKLN